MKYRILLFSCLLFHQGWSQLKVGYWLDSDVVRIPFEMVNHSVFVKVNLNKYRNLSFIVDTGSSFSVVFTDSILQVPAQFKVASIRGFGKLDSIPANISVYNTLSMGGLTSYGQQILVVDAGEVGFQQFFDRPLHGIIGLDVLRNYDLEINFITQKLILRKNIEKEKKNKRWVKVPFEILNNSLLVPAVISNHRMEKDSIYLVLDTGSELPLLLQQQYSSPNALRTIIGLGFLGYATGWMGKTTELQIGNITVSDVITSFPDSASVRWNPLLPQQGNLGIQFLKQFRVIIDYDKNYMQLKPLRKFNRGETKYNRSGMAIRSLSTTVCAYFIDEIAHESPAEKAGLMKGDRIISIKDTTCPQMTLELINDQLFSNNPALRIQIYRNLTVMVFTLDLRQ